MTARISMLDFRGPRARATVVLGVALGGGALAFAPACSDPWRAPPPPLDCSQDSSYDKYETYEPGTAWGWYGYGDTSQSGSWLGQDGGFFTAEPDATPGLSASWTPPVVPIENGGRCGSTMALLLVDNGFHDYGSGFGQYSPFATLPLPPVAAAGYEGLAFWARSPGVSSKSVTLTINDASTLQNLALPNTCVLYATDAGTGLYTTLNPGSNPNVPTGSTVASAQPPANSCGNGFTFVLTTTPDWQLYKIPFTAFHQGFQPDRLPAFDPTTFSLITVIVPKEAQLQLWLDDIGLYPKKTGP